MRLDIVPRKVVDGARSCTSIYQDGGAPHIRDNGTHEDLRSLP